MDMSDNNCRQNNSTRRLGMMVFFVLSSCCGRAMAWTTTNLPARARCAIARSRGRYSWRTGGGVALNQRPLDRRSFYTIDDAFPSERKIPPTLDSMDEEGIGEYADLETDPAELERMMQEEEAVLSAGKPAIKMKVQAYYGNETPPSTETPPSVEKLEGSSEVSAAGPPIFESIEVRVERGPKFQSYGNDSEEIEDDEKDSDIQPIRIQAIMPPRDVPADYEQVNPELDDFLAQASYGSGATTTVDLLQMQLDDVVKAIYQQNNDKEFNINSARQVSEVIFGSAGESTKKDALEGMAGAGNRMADLILQYRHLKQRISRLARKQESIEKGTSVRSASTTLKARDEAPHSTDPLILVDASAYIFRAYYSMPPIHRADGMPTGAVMGFCNMLNRLVLNRLLEGEQPRVALVFDARGKTFRHDLYSSYKANRPEAPVDLIPQFSLIRYAAQAYGAPQIEAQNFEADDVIATLSRMAREEGLDVNILTGDKDLMQLISDEGVEPVINMIDPLKMERVTAKEVEEKWGVKPALLGDILALSGDAVDNVPGVPGIGPKTAALLIEEFGSLENLLNNLDKIKQKGRRAKLEENIDQARLSRLLVDLDSQVPFETMTFPEGVSTVRDLHMEPLDGDRLLAFYDAMGFRDLKFRVKARLDGVKRKRTPSKYSGKPKAELPKPEEYEDVPF